MTLDQENKYITHLIEAFGESKYSGWTQWSELSVQEKREFARFFIFFFEQEKNEKQFCDCYEHDFRTAVRKLATIMDIQPINDSMKTTATMYVETAHEMDKNRYVKHLEERIEKLETDMYARIDSDFLSVATMINPTFGGDVWQISKKDWNKIMKRK